MYWELTSTTHWAGSLASKPDQRLRLCVHMHARDLKKVAESDDRIWAVAAWRDTPFFTDAERLRWRLSKLSPGSATARTRYPMRCSTRPPSISAAALASLILNIASINVWNCLQRHYKARGRSG